MYFLLLVLYILVPRPGIFAMILKKMRKAQTTALSWAKGALKHLNGIVKAADHPMKEESFEEAMHELDKHLEILDNA